MAKSKEASLSSWKDEEARWQCEQDMRTLMDAEKIKKDPKRMKAVQQMAKEKMMAVASLASELEEKKS